MAYDVEIMRDEEVGQVERLAQGFLRGPTLANQLRDERGLVVLVEGCQRRMSGDDPEAEGKPDDLTFVLVRTRRPS